MKLKITLLIILAVLLAAEIGLVAVLSSGEGEITLQATEPATLPEATEVLSTEAIVDITEPAETLMPTETMAPTEPPETEPKEKHYTLSFAGDCTFGSVNKNWSNGNHFIQTIGENYDYPFDNVREFFENDDFTIINLEGPLTDSSSGAQSKTFAFRGPTAYTQIMTGSSVEAVTLANNHAEDYGKAGYESTTKALSEAGITYVEKNKTAMYTTESGLKIGLYAAAFSFDTKDMKNDIATLRKDGAEIVICAFHWGEEGVYRADANQQKVAKAAIDAGADIVYGHHPHVLQKIEQYNDGYIFYSLGNFSFGGAALPGDYDTALLQLDVVRDESGKVSLGELTIIPCSISSTTKQNNFQPTPLAESDKAYNRVLSKLDGSFKGANLNVDYSKLDPTPVETTPPATQAPSGGDNTGDGDGGSSGGGSETPAPGGDGGSSDGGNSSGGDSGSGGGSETPAPGGDGGSSDGGNSSGGDSGSGGGSETPAAGGDGGSSDGGSSSGGDSGSGGGESAAGSDGAAE